MVIYDRKKFTNIKVGSIVYVYEHEFDYGSPHEQVLVLSEIIITTQPGRPGHLTGWGLHMDAVEPTKEDIKEITREALSDFFLDVRQWSWNFGAVNSLSHVEVLEGSEYSNLKKIMIKGIEVK